MNDSEFFKNNELEKTHWWFRGRRAVLRKVLGSLDLPQRAAILEAGCGTGGNLPMLGEFGVVDAMEYNPLALKMARDNHPSLSISQGELPGNIPYPRGKYDLVCAFDVLEHVERDGEAVAALARMLKPGGKLVCTAPANQWMWSEHDAVNNHFRRYSLKGFASLFAVDGLHVDVASYFNTLLFPAIALVRLCLKETDGDLKAASPFVNAVLRRIFSFERYLLPGLSLPFGVSVLCVATRR